MPESGPCGSVRGVCSNAHPYRDAESIALIAVECPVLVRRNGGLGSFTPIGTEAPIGGSVADSRPSRLDGRFYEGVCQAPLNSGVQ